MSTHEHTQAVFAALFDPATNLITLANELDLSLTEVVAIAGSPEVTAAIEALEKLAAIRARVQIALGFHTAVATLERIAAMEATTPTGIECARKAAAQLLRMSAKSVPLHHEEGVAESAEAEQGPGEHGGAEPRSPRPARSYSDAPNSHGEHAYGASPHLEPQPSQLNTHDPTIDT